MPGIKEEMNTQKKEIQKKGKAKRRAYQCPRPLSWNIYVKKQCRHRFITIGFRSLWSPRCWYMWFSLALVWPCQLFVRLWYRVSDVPDLSLVSKRFGFSVPRPLSWNIYVKKQCRHTSRAGYNNVWYKGSLRDNSFSRNFLYMRFRRRRL
jgi:hypothetical protein